MHQYKREVKKKRSKGKKRREEQKRKKVPTSQKKKRKKEKKRKENNKEKRKRKITFHLAKQREQESEIQKKLAEQNLEILLSGKSGKYSNRFSSSESREAVPLINWADDILSQYSQESSEPSSPTDEKSHMKKPVLTRELSLVSSFSSFPSFPKTSRSLIENGIFRDPCKKRPNSLWRSSPRDALYAAIAALSFLKDPNWLLQDILIIISLMRMTGKKLNMKNLFTIPMPRQRGKIPQLKSKERRGDRELSAKASTTIHLRKLI